MFRHRGKVQENKQESGIYTCSNCGQVLFEAKYKFSVGSGFPSFWDQVGEHVQQSPLDTYGRERIQLLCSQCKQHLGHLFEDARTLSHVRYCINADALKYKI
ncbi:peptide-methionine (R)-S-oxide reductase [Pontibacter sp. KCTC 32443]|uniref:peptide-methionine (R)-S-oxide reductase n=1 Tax=Pontibacter TaxID=323449 RepID=UPI00164E96EA|nr:MULTISPECIES: peptide-methionine (R)-S-oxide reductase [Pontibacter]MBC5774597.1 peptide-methionine (R)-S-oxide reductase [Pontibacter sp. KCTC 32443]